jgi:hypothetical protein
LCYYDFNKLFRGEVNINNTKKHDGKVKDLPVGEILKGLICPENREHIRASGGEIKVEALMEKGKQKKMCVVVRDGVQEIFGPNTEVLSVVMC